MRFAPNAVNLGQPVNWSHPLNRGLQAWYLCLPGGPRGMRWLDLCNRNHGDLTNMVGAANWGGPLGRPGGNGSLDFDGSNDYVECGTSSILELGGHMTISLWYKPNGNYTGENSLVGRSDSGGNKAPYVVAFGSGAADNKFNLWVNTARPLDSVFTLSTDTWTHVTITRLGVAGAWNLAMYINGKLDNTATSAVNPDLTGTQNTTIGKFGGYGAGLGYNGKGRIDDVRLWNRGLSAAEAWRYHVESKTGYPRVLNRGRRMPYRRLTGDRAFFTLGEASDNPGFTLRK